MIHLQPLHRLLALCVLLATVFTGCRTAPEADSDSTTDAADTLRQPRPETDTSIPPRFETYGASDGLSTNETYRVIQDRQGFIWVATNDGLSRFDGATFRTFHHDAADSLSLADDMTYRLFESDDGAIWIGMETGLDRFDPATETFTHFRHDPEDPRSLGGGSVADIAQDSLGTLWVGTWGGGLNQFDAETQSFRQFMPIAEDSTSLPHANVYALVPDSSGGMWVGTATGLARTDPIAASESGTPRYRVTKVPIDVAQFGGPSYLTAYSLRLDRSGELWIGTFARGLVRFNPKSGVAKNYLAGPSGLGHPWVLAIFEDGAGVLWVGTNGGGLHQYDPDTDRFRRYVSDPLDASSLPGDRVRAIMEDRTGVLWVATEMGLARRLPLSRFVAHERYRTEDPLSLRANDVTAFAEDASGALWVGTDGGGLNRRDPTNGSYQRVALPTSESMLADNASIVTLSTTSNGEMWVSTMSDRGLFRSRGASFDYVDVTDSTGAQLPIRAIRDLLPGPSGTMWVGSQYGLYGIDPITQRGQRFAPNPADTTSTVAQTIFALEPAGGGTLWAAGDQTTLLRFDPGSGSFSDRRVKTADSLSIGTVLSILTAADGTLWLGTTGGLERVDADGSTRRYGRAEGLPNATINGLLEDPASNLWVTTNRGLVRLDPRSGAMRSYGAADGLQGDVFNPGAAYRSPQTGLFYVGGANGYNIFDPADLAGEPPPPPVVFTGLDVADRPARIGVKGSPLARAVSLTDEVRLRFADRVVTFSFAALDYRAPSAQRFSVMLEGFEEEWRDVGQSREATFTNLGPGRYTLRVRAAAGSGEWGPEGRLSLVVTPPWWRAWWAYLVYALLAGLAVWRVDRFQRRQIHFRHRLEIERLEADKLRDLDRSKSRFFANVSHEFRTPLTLTMGPLDDVLAGEHGEVAEPVRQQLSLARRSANRVLDLINQILDLSRLETGNAPFRPQRIDLRATVEAQADAFRAVAERRGVQWLVHLGDEPVEAVVDQDHVRTILGNLLSNAFKFTPDGGTVRVALDRRADAAVLTVRDSGPGIPSGELERVFDRFYQVAETGTPRALGTGIGLALARELAQLHGGTLTAASEDGFGSTFTLSLPIGTLERHAASEVAVTPAELAEPVRPVDSMLATSRQVPHGDGPTDLPTVDVTTVLVVDDHADIRAYVRHHLEAEGYRVLEAADGRDGLAVARQRLPDLVLSDVMMPGFDGYELCRALKQDADTDFIPVVLLTARASQDDRLVGLREQADAYLTKPFDVAELKASVANLIATRRRLRERYSAAGSGDGTGYDRSGIHAPGVEMTSADATFLADVHAAIEARLDDSDFDVEALAAAVGQSRSTLHRRLTAVAGQTPSEAIRIVRLERAAQLLQAGTGTVSEVAYAVGFKSVAHFSNGFTAHHGCRPSAYAEADADSARQAL